MSIESLSPRRFSHLDKNLHPAVARAAADCTRAFRVTIESLESRRLLSAGDLATGFGTGGVLRLPAVTGHADAVAIQNDGKIVVAGFTFGGAHDGDFVVDRYNADGSIDKTFGTNGEAAVDFGHVDTAQGVAALADGKIVVIGNVDSGADGIAIGIARLNADGSLDATFGTGGRRVDGFPGVNAIRAVTVDGSGRIVAAGTTVLNDVSAASVFRFNADGTPDGTFGAGGRAVAQFGSSSDQRFNGLALTGDGGIIAAGGATIGSDSQFAVAKFTAAGALDGTFGTSGEVTTPVGTSSGQAYGVAVRDDGRIVAAGRARDAAGGFEMEVAQYTPAGTPDGAFLNNGTGTIDAPASAWATTVTNVGNDQVLVGGVANFDPTGADTSRGQPAFARLNGDGSLDTTFSAGGALLLPGIASGDRVEDVAVAGDGKIVAAAASGSPGDVGFSVLRVTPDGQLDTTFGGDGHAAHPTAVSDLHAVAALPGGKLLVGGVIDDRSGKPNTTAYLARYNADGSLDVSFGSGGRVIDPAVTYTGGIQSLTLTGDGKIVAVEQLYSASYAPIGFELLRFNADGSADTTFGARGEVASDFGGGRDTVNAVVVGADGSIYVGGAQGVGAATGTQLAVKRFTSIGKIDTTFGSNGLAVVASINAASALALTGSGAVLAGGGTFADGSTSFALARFTSAGALDMAFGTNGVTTTPIGSNGGSIARLVVGTDGKILAGGTLDNDGVGPVGGQVVVARYNADGSLDGSFGAGGTTTSRAPGTTNDVLTGLAIAADGSIFAGGGAGNGTSNFALFKYTPAGVPDPSFGTDGVVTTPIAGGGAAADDLAIRSDGSVALAGYARPGSAIAVYDAGTKSVYTPPPAAAPITVTGTDAADAITVTDDNGTIDVTLNGSVVASTPASGPAPIVIRAGGGNDTVTVGADVLIGVSISGGGGNDSITGGGGNDTINGNGGADTILGGAGNDQLHGAGGADSINGQGGSDAIYGGGGNDTLVGGRGNDSLTAGAGHNVLRGGAGNDTIDAANGSSDSIFGGLGTDSAKMDVGLDVGTVENVLS